MDDEAKEFLARIEASMCARLARPDAWLTQVNTHLVGAGGKRLRAKLVRLSGKDGDLERLVQMATAIELVHLGSLVHDDVLDHSETRRGERSVHGVWGNRVAALSGATIFCVASRIVAELDVAALRSAFATLVSELAGGIVSEVLSHEDVELPTERYFEIIRKKTATLFGFSCRAGAIVGGRPAVEVDLLARFGESFGMFFQLVDDILDVIGADAHATRAGTDLRGGFYTLPVLLALREGNGAAQELRRLLESGPPVGKDLGLALALVRESPGLIAARGEARKLGALALRTLEQCPSLDSSTQLAPLVAERLARIGAPPLLREEIGA